VRGGEPLPSARTDNDIFKSGRLRCAQNDGAFLRVRLCGLEGDDGDFRGAVETEGEAHGADAAVDVELQPLDAVEAFGVLLGPRREDERTEEGQLDLAAMGVTAKHEVDERTARVGEDVVGIVGRVCHEDDGTVGFWGNGQVEVGVAGAGVVDAAEPEAVAVALDGNVLIDQNGSAIGGERPDHHGGVEGDVVVAEDAVAEGCGEAGEDLGAAVDGMAAGDEGEGAVGDEVAGEEDEIGGDGVNFVDDVFQEEGLGVLVEVNVAELDDAIAVEGGGQIVDGDGAMDDVEFVTGELAGVESESGGGDARSYEEISPGEACRLGRGGAGHMQ
jgi:hypothetical protein